MLTHRLMISFGETSFVTAEKPTVRVLCVLVCAFGLSGVAKFPFVTEMEVLPAQLRKRVKSEMNGARREAGESLKESGFFVIFFLLIDLHVSGMVMFVVIIST